MYLERISKKEKRRTIKQLREHYVLEKKLATQLREAKKQDRTKLYLTLYNELYQKIPHHPQLVRKADVKRQAEHTAAQMQLLKGFLHKSDTFLELGPGDCHLSLEISKCVKKVFAIDVSDEITKTSLQLPKNFELILSDGTSVNVPSESISVAFSNQLMEHLHPGDAIDQLQNVYNALVPGGIYICITPNRFKGPTDISKYFDNVATGFHLKEYTYNELYRLFKKVGFSKIQSLKNARVKYVKFPIFPARVVECLLSPIPQYLKRKLSSAVIVRTLLSICLIATK